MKKNIIQKYLDGEINLSDNYTYDELLVLCELSTRSNKHIHLAIMPYSNHIFYKKLYSHKSTPEKVKFLCSMMKPTLENVSDVGINKLFTIFKYRALELLPEHHTISLHGSIKANSGRTIYVFKLQTVHGRVEYVARYRTSTLEFDEYQRAYYRRIEFSYRKIYLGYYYLIVNRSNNSSIISKAIYDDYSHQIRLDDERIYGYTIQNADDVFYFKTKSECLEAQKNLFV